MSCKFKIKGQEQEFNSLEELAAALYNGEISDEILPEEFRAKTKVDTSKIDKQIQELRSTQRQGLSPLQKQQELIRDILRNNEYLANYYGDDLAQSRRKAPKAEEVSRYEELTSKINRKVVNNVAQIVNRASDFYKDLGLSKEEVDELKNLNKTLNDWKTFQGVGIADTLELINAMQENAKSTDTKTDVEDKDIIAVKDAFSDLEKDAVKTGVRGIQASVNVVVTSYQGNLIFSHIDLENFAKLFEGGVLTDAPLDHKEKGGSFTITTLEGEVKGKITDKISLEIKKADFDKLHSKDVVIKSFSDKGKYTIVNQRVNEEIGFEPIPSDYKIRDKDGREITIDLNALNGVEKGDKLTLVYSKDDHYNYNVVSKMKSKTEKISNMNIYVYKRDSLIGVLPAVNSKSKTDEDKIYALRESIYKATEGKKAQTNTTFKDRIEASFSFIGSPNVTLNEDGTTKNRNFNQQDLENVISTGFIQDGVITSNSNIDINEFIRGVSKANPGKKVPFVVFRNNGKTVAFPVSLIKTTVDKSTDSTSAKALVDALNESGLGSDNYKIDFTLDDWKDLDETKRAQEDLAKSESVVDIDAFSDKKYDTKNLVGDATIAINISNKPFSSSKVLFQVSEEVFNDVSTFEEQLNSTEQEKLDLVDTLSKEALDLYKNFISNSDFQEIEDVHFTDVFAETPIEEPNSYLDRLKNINTLSDALSKPIRGKLKEALGAENIAELKSMIAKYKSLLEKETILKGKIKEEAEKEKNKEC